MPDQQAIYLNGKIFLGRVEEQKQFRAALQDTLNLPQGEDQPYIILLYGGGGMGKTTLAQRFCDIAIDEPPFEGEFETVWLDWEDARRKNTALQTGRDNISPETVLDEIHATLIRHDKSWGRHFRDYQKMIKQRGEVEKKVAEIMSSGEESDEMIRAFRGVSTSALAKFIRFKVPLGDTGEQLTQQFLEAGVTVAAGQVFNMRQALQTRLQARLKADQYQLFLKPHEQLAMTLGKGLQAVAKRKPLILFLDTYEIVDHSDMWLREVIKAAGPKLLWVIGGRHNLMQSRQFGAEYFQGYAETFPRRLLAYDMRQLALADVEAYFADAAPQRPLSEADAQALSQATRGIPLAIKTAAEIWQRGVDVSEIIGNITNATPHNEIVERMTNRYLLHVVKEEDKEALYALALAQGDIDILRAMLQPAEDERFDVGQRIVALRRAYAAVHLQEARLHDEPADFITAYLNEDIQRQNPAIQHLHKQAVAVLNTRIDSLNSEMPLLEERCEDDEWIQAALDKTRYLFWKDEQHGWQWFIPRFVESLAYSRTLRQGLLDVATAWKPYMNRRSQHRLKKLTVGLSTSFSVEEETMLQELADLARPSVGWLNGEGKTERKAILSLRWGKLAYRQKEYKKALGHYEQTEKGLPDEGEKLKHQLGVALDDLARQFMWPEKQTSAVYSTEAAQILPKVVQWLPERQVAWYRLGVIYSLSGHYQDAINTYKKAVELDPKDALPHNGLGNVYRQNARFPEAIDAYNNAIELDPNYAHPHNGLGNIYRENCRFPEAINAYNKAIQLDPKYATPHHGLGNVYSDNGRYQDAIDAYNKAIQLDPNLAEPHYGLENVYRQNGRYQDAIDDFNKAIQLDPNFAAPQNGLGHVYIETNHHQKAIASFKKAIKLDPEAKDSLYTLALLYRNKGKFVKAIRACQQIIAQNPKDWEAQNGLGYLFLQIDDLEQSEIHLEQAIDINEEPLNYLNLGIVRWRQGDAEKARESFFEALALLESQASQEDNNEKLATAGWLNVVTYNEEYGLKQIYDTLSEQGHFNDLANLRDWTNSLLKATDPPHGLEKILEII